MAYVGTSVATTLQNPPINIVAGVGIGRGSSSPAGFNKSIWVYTSTNLTTDITAANFFTDGWYLGMRPGDLVMGSQLNGSSIGTSIVTFWGAVATVTTAGAALSTGSLVTSTFA